MDEHQGKFDEGRKLIDEIAKEIRVQCPELAPDWEHLDDVVRDLRFRTWIERGV